MVVNNVHVMFKVKSETQIATNLFILEEKFRSLRWKQVVLKLLPDDERDKKYET